MPMDTGLEQAEFTALSYAKAGQIKFFSNYYKESSRSSRLLFLWS